MWIFLPAQFSAIADATYTGSVFLSADFTGDGTADVVESWPDSLIIYQGVSTARLVKYVSDGSSLTVMKIRDNRLLYVASNYSPDTLNWRVYDNFTSLVHSTTYTGTSSYPVFVWAWTDADGDGASEIIVGFGGGEDSVALYSGNSPSTALATYRRSGGFSILNGGLLSTGTMVILYGNSSDVYFKVYENFTNAVYTSPTHTYAGYGSDLYVVDYDGNGTKDIVLILPQSGGSKDVHVYATTYTLLSDGRKALRFERITPDRPLHLSPNTGETFKTGGER